MRIGAAQNTFALHLFLPILASSPAAALPLPQVLYETGSTRWLVEALEELGHNTKRFPIGGSIVQVCL